MLSDLNDSTKWRFMDVDGIEFPLSKHLDLPLHKDLECPFCKRQLEKGEELELVRMLPAIHEGKPVTLNVSPSLFDKLKALTKETSVWTSFQIFYLKGGVEQKIVLNGKSEDDMRLYFKEHYGYEIVRMCVYESQ